MKRFAMNLGSTLLKWWAEKGIFDDFNLRFQWSESRMNVLSFMIVFFLLLSQTTNAQFSRCETKPKFQKALLQDSQNVLETRSTITIPIVVHVVWHEAEENISDEQILSQIEVLNEDFQAENVEIPTVPISFLPHLADIEFEFCLAEGGIERIYTNVPNIGSNAARLKYTGRGGADAWNTNKYLNFWVAKRSDGILGAATTPESAEAAEQGLIIDYRAFGRLGVAVNNTPFNLGRTATHELGHYFGLQHLWGEFSTCADDDGLEDTPFQSVTYSNQCPNTPVSSCGSSDMYMNFMNYTDDACMAMFTNDQKNLMLAYLNTFRAGLLDNNACSEMTAVTKPDQQGISLYPNPTKGKLWLQLPKDLPSHTSIFIHNTSGKLLQTIPLHAREMRLELENLQNGIYFLTIKAQEIQLTKRFILLK